MPKWKTTVEDRFWEKVDIKGKDECWLWKASVRHFGYGQFWDGERIVAAHRYAYEWWFSRSLEGRLGCHKCDNPLCVNPFHIFPGTQVDNIQDMMTKGRRYQPDTKGIKNGRAKFYLLPIEEIKEKSKLGRSITSIAKEYRVGWSTIKGIVTGDLSI